MKEVPAEHGTRSYRQTARAAAAEQRTEAILEAALDLFLEVPYAELTLAAIADRAGVGLQTVLRRFGSKEGLVEATGAWIGPQVAAHLGPAADPDPSTVAHLLAAHYERWGRAIGQTNRQEASSPALAANAASGRRAHREWIAATYAETLAPHRGAARQQLLAQLVAVTDFETWQTLTVHCGLTPARARTAMAELIAATLSLHA